ncbi:unnamed protein product [Hermetia illucens]|uniref:DUF4485 domain-containing protein n=1 Tax=Hermetia illucens TaxID=343691 RepID=A0A7R8YNV2_HERIL|nr:unnamed protein product [Hermetia illucens]
MASPSQVEPRQYIEILDEEFSQYLEVAQSIAKTMKRPKDKKICIKYIRKCMELDAPNIEVKAHRNEFFRYFLRMLQSTAASQPPQYDAWPRSLTSRLSSSLLCNRVVRPNPPVRDKCISKVTANRCESRIFPSNEIMASLLFTGVLILLASASLILAHRRRQNDNDPGQPLFLTTSIKSGKVQEARRAAEVPGRLFANIRSYSGYLTVNEKYKSNMFFWYCPAKNNPETAPIILWLEGGPGASSIFGLFIENGPVEMTDNGNVQRRTYSWNNDYNVVYIDNPVGSGYSFTENDAGYAQNNDDVNRDLYEALSQLYKLFPQFENLPLYIAGSSYAGKFVTALGYKIHKTQEEATKAGNRPPVNIKLGGLAMGNAFVDPITQIDYGDNLFGLGLIDEDGLAIFKKMEAEIHACIERNDDACVNRVSERLTTNAMGTTEGTVLGNLTGYNYLFKFVTTEFDITSFPAWFRFIQQPSTRKAIHVGNTTFHHLEPNSIVDQKLRKSISQSVAPWLAELLNHYRVCVYNGQMDLLITYWPTVRYLRKLQFNGAQDYKAAPRQFKPSAKPKESSRISSFWSHDKRTYIAAKQIPGCGTLIYLATSYDPRLGWQKFGFSSPN